VANKNDTELCVSRVIQAPREAIWKAWEDPEHFVKWWAPSPVITSSNKHDFFTGGGFDTTMQFEDGSLAEMGEACFLEIVEFERIVFTDALQGGWKPNEDSFMSAIISLEDHPDGILYTAVALHKNAKDCQTHLDMGFMEGWGTAIDQLAELAKTLKK